jgi:hypothetical protein
MLTIRSMKVIMVLMILMLQVKHDNFRMNTSYGRYGAAYNMVALSCFNDEFPCV